MSGVGGMSAPFQALARVALRASLAATIAAPAPVAAEPPIPAPMAWQEPAPVARLFLQLPFEAPEVTPPRALEVGLRLLYSNSLLAARSDQLALDIHVETAQPMLWLHYGVSSGIEAQLALPLVVDHGGFLDRPIEVVEGWFGAANPQRKGRPRNVARYRLTGPNGSGILRDGSGAGLGDVWAGIKIVLAGTSGGDALAVRCALKLPTGRLPYGSEEVDAGASLLAAWSWTSTALRLQLDAAVPTASLPAADIRTRPYGAFQAGIARRLGDAVTLQLQGSVHLSPLEGTGLGQLDGTTAYVAAGATFRLSRAVGIDAGVVENVFSPYRGADITFLVGVKHAAVAGGAGAR
jgi:Protein of unknown function (DUF3187)